MIVKGKIVTEPERDYRQVAKRCASCCVVFVICITVVIVAIVVVRELAATGNSGEDDIKRGDGKYLHNALIRSFGKCFKALSMLKYFDQYILQIL